MKAVFDASNTAPLSCSTSQGLVIFLLGSSSCCLPQTPPRSRLCNRQQRPSNLRFRICICTRSALKNRNKIGASGDPCDSPDCGSWHTSDGNPLTVIQAHLPVQKSSIHVTKSSGICLHRILSISGACATLLYAPFTSKDTSDRVLRPPRIKDPLL